MGTLIVGLLVLIAVVLAVRKIIRDRKNGVGACGGNCSSCQACHFHPADKKKP